MMEIIISGSPRDIQFVKSVCRAKVRRGDLRITAVPCAETGKPKDDVFQDDDKAFETADSKEPPVSDDKSAGNTDNKDLPEADAKGKRTK